MRYRAEELRPYVAIVRTESGEVRRVEVSEVRDIGEALASLRETTTPEGESFTVISIG